METKTSLKITYILAFFGDLTLSLIITTSIMYGVILGATPIENGFIGAAYGFSYLLMPAVMGWIGDKMPRKVSLLIASIGQFSIAGYFTFLVATIFDLMFGLVLMGVFYGFYWQSIEAYISEKTSHSEIEHKKGISSFCIAWSTGYMLGPLFAGILRDFNIKIAFILLMVFYGLIFCLIVFGLPGIKIQKENQKEEKMEHQVISSIENNLKPDNQGSVNNKLLLNILFAMLIYALMGRIALTYFTDYATRGLPEGLGWTGTLTGQILFCYGVGRTSYFLFGRNFKSSLKTIQYSSLLTGILLIFIAFITNE
ncbi:MAG: MFS transporter, partial [archaeon]|nr:MFS transporter [archaeon]